MFVVFLCTAADKILNIKNVVFIGNGAIKNGEKPLNEWIKKINSPNFIKIPLWVSVMGLLKVKIVGRILCE